MNTQVIFKVDKKLKDQAMRKAQSQGLPFGVILKLATKAFVQGSFDVGLIGTENFNDRTRKNMMKALKDIKTGRNLSPGFRSANEAIAYLKK